MVKSRKLFLSLMAIIICVTIVCGTVTALTFLSTTPSQGPLININQPDTLPQGCISSDQAIQIAMPYINQYLSEHNKTLTNIQVTFHDSYKDWEGQKGNSSLWYPVWFVETNFPFPQFGDPNTDYVVSYSVGIWADSGQVMCEGPSSIE
jgi:hypothetical protein